MGGKRKRSVVHSFDENKTRTGAIFLSRNRVFIVPETSPR